MKIVHVVQYFQPLIGYQETFLARRQIELGHRVTVLTSDRYVKWPNYDQIYRPLLGDRIVGPCRRDEQHIDTWRLPSVEFQNHPWCPGLGRALNSLKPDAVHLHNVGHFMSLSVLRHKLTGAGYRLVIDEHNTTQVANPGTAHGIYRKLFSKFIAGRIKKAANAVVGVTTDSCVFSEKQFGVPPDMIGMIPLGSDHRVFAFNAKGKTRIRTELGIPNEAKVLIYTGKIRAEKKVCELVEMMPELLRRVPDAYLVIVGHSVDHYLRQIRNRINVSNIENRVRLCEAVPASQLPDWFSMADLACWPAEVTISMIDAAACSLPVLAPKADGVEYQISGGNGEFIEDMSLAQKTLGAQVASLFSDEEKLKQMGKNGRALVERELSWDAVNARFMKLYEGFPPKPYRIDRKKPMKTDIQHASELRTAEGH